MTEEPKPLQLTQHFGWPKLYPPYGPSLPMHPRFRVVALVKIYPPNGATA